MDRNNPLETFIILTKQSLSARRAWIEILSMGLDGRFKLSLSARRAWIEILFYGSDLSYSDGSLSARRAWIEIRLLTI